MKNKIIIIISFFVCFLNNSFAKTYEIEKDGEISVIISKYNPNRIKVINDRIKRIDCNESELNIRNDSNTGELFLKPSSFEKDNIDLFIITEQGITYKLLLKVKDTISQQIFLKRKEFTLQNYAGSSDLRREKLIADNMYFNFDEDFKIASINLLKHMSQINELKEFNIIQRDGNILKYKNGLKVSLEYSYIKNDNSNISGEILYIKNISKNNIELKEEDFFAKGIRAVKLDKQILKPKESCYLYQIGGDK